MPIQIFMSPLVMIPFPPKRKKAQEKKPGAATCCPSSMNELKSKLWHVHRNVISFSNQKKWRLDTCNNLDGAKDKQAKRFWQARNLLCDTIIRLTGKHGATVKENGLEAKGLGSLNSWPKVRVKHREWGLRLFHILEWGDMWPYMC